MLELRPGCECCDRDLPPESIQLLVRTELDQQLDVAVHVFGHDAPHGHLAGRHPHRLSDFAHDDVTYLPQLLGGSQRARLAVVVERGEQGLDRGRGLLPPRTGLMPQDLLDVRDLVLQRPSGRAA